MNYIIDPINKNKYNINSFNGKKLLKNYIRIYKAGALNQNENENVNKKKIVATGNVHIDTLSKKKT